MKSRSVVIGFATLLIVLMGANAAQSLTGSDTVFSDDIVDGEVTSADIKDGQVRALDIGDDQVRSSDIRNNVVTGLDIQNNAVSADKILDKSITANDLGPSIRKAYFAIVNDAVTQVSLNGGDATGVTRPAQGQYTLTFPFDTSKCGITATAGNAVTSGGIASPASYTFIVQNVLTDGTVKISVVRQTAQAPFYAYVSRGFELTLVCP